MKKIVRMISFTGLLVALGCNNDDDRAKALLATFIVPINCPNSIPMVIGRGESGMAVLKLYADNTLFFRITVGNLSASDYLTVAHIHSGDVVSTGDVVIMLVDGVAASFSGGTAEGIMQLTQEQASFMRENPAYININSLEKPQGLLRGQIGQHITHACSTALSPNNEIPPVVGRNETGNAYIRVVGNVMYYKIEVSDLATADAVTAGHIHEGTALQSGNIFLGLGIFDNTQLSTVKSLQLSNADLYRLRTESLYINIHSSQEPMGLIRGQIR